MTASAGVMAGGMVMDRTLLDATAGAMGATEAGIGALATPIWTISRGTEEPGHGARKVVRNKYLPEVHLDPR